MTLNNEFTPSASTQTNGAALLYTASDLQPLWASMICTVLSLHAGNTHEQRQSTLLSTYFPHLVEKSVVLWWFYSISWCFRSILLNPVMSRNFRKKFCILFWKFELAYMSVICFALARLWGVSFLLTLLHLLISRVTPPPQHHSVSLSYLLLLGQIVSLLSWLLFQHKCVCMCVQSHVTQCAEIHSFICLDGL